VGVLYSVTKLGISPEEALLIGNVFAFLVAANRRYQMVFTRRLQEADDIFSYQFSMPKGLKFKAGQYMEWTIAHNRTDSRGNRRYFTISSSPSEPGVMFTVKLPSDKPSAFKQRLERLKPGDIVLASDLSGTFTLPKDPSKKLAFLAGGVGITPFRSIAKYMIDSGGQRDAALIYSASKDTEFSFKNVFDKAAESGLKTFYETGRLDGAKISSLLPDYKSRRFYISGPYGFVHAMESALLRQGVGQSNIVTDYFPGYGA
jgi:glycine betaine catabolism B